MEPRLLPPEPLADLAAYQAVGGGEGLARARQMGPEEVIETLRASGLRGRGGAGFPTGIKWRGIRGDPGDGERRFVVCNAAEGEPGTFKDRAILAADPYSMLEGIAIAALVIEAEEAHIGIKASYRSEIGRLETAATEMADVGWLDHVDVRLTAGPDDYLFGEEKALLEVIEGRDALPRLYPPYVVGLDTGLSAGLGAGSVGASGRVNPTLVNNVETFANVARIVANGPEWFRSLGTDDSPGTMVFTVSGDVARPTVSELPMGTPLSALVFGIGGGPRRQRSVHSVWPGASNAPLNSDQLDTPLSFEGFVRAGSGLGSGGMVVYDETACVADVGAAMSRFLADESCGQCPPCQLGTTALASSFASFCNGTADPYTLQEMSAWMQRVTDANRCGLGAGQQAVVAGVLARFAHELEDHLERGCPTERRVRVPKLAELTAGGFVLDD